MPHPTKPALLVFATIAIFLLLLSAYRSAGIPSRLTFSLKSNLSPLPAGPITYLSECTNASTANIYEREVVHADGTRIFTYSRPSLKSNLLWLVLTKDKSSWGAKDERDFKSFFDLIVVSGLDIRSLSLGILTSDENEYRNMIQALSPHLFARFTIILHKGYAKQSYTSRNRQDPAVQTARRVEVAKLRNYLMLKSLHDEPHILWSDAEVHFIEKGMVQLMKGIADQNNGVGMITARTFYGTNENYDKNSWAGLRPPPERLALKDEAMAEAENGRQRLLDEVLSGSRDDELVSLTSVGSAILYVRASLVWQGLNFPTQYTVGTRWNQDGYDGLESEGLCYRARNLERGACFSLGGKWHVRHVLE